MKRFFAIVGAALLLAVGLVAVNVGDVHSQQPYFYTLVIRTFADIRGKTVVGDSARVDKRFLLSVAAGSRTGFKTGSMVVDTLVVSGIIKSTSHILLQNKDATTASDTAAKPRLWVKSVTTDTAFILQQSTAVLDTVAYNYLIVN